MLPRIWGTTWAVLYAVVMIALSSCAEEGPDSQAALATARGFLGDQTADLQPDGESYDGLDYAFRSPDGLQMVSVTKAGGWVSSYARTDDPPPVGPDGPALNPDEARVAALEYARATKVPVDVDRLDVRVCDTAPDQQHLAALSLSLRENDVEMPVAFEVRIRFADGVLQDLFAVNYLPVRVPLAPRVSEQEAVAKAKRAVSADGMRNVKAVEARLRVWIAYWLDYDTATLGRDHQVLLWTVTLEGEQPTEMITGKQGVVKVPMRQRWTLDVDAGTGDVRDVSGVDALETPEELRAKLPPEPRRLDPGDFGPAWDGNTRLYFSSDLRTTRGWGTSLGNEALQSILRADLASGRVECIVPKVLPITPAAPLPSPDRTRLAFGISGEQVMLDMTTGTVGYALPGEGGPSYRAWMPDGTRVLFNHWTAGPGAGIGSVAVTAPPTSSLGSSPFFHTNADVWGLACAPAGKWVAYVVAPQGTCSIHVISLSPAGEPVGEPRRIADGLADVTSISAFPDSKRLLVSSTGGWDTIDVETGHNTRVFDGAMADPDTPERELYDIREAVIDPTGTRVAFSGWRWSGDPDDAILPRIYVCNLDGSDVKRVTSMDDEPVEPYVFPASGKTAIDVGRELQGHMEELRRQMRGER